MYHFLLVLFVIIAVVLILLIILQQNKHNDSGGIFGNRSLGNVLHSSNFGDGITRIIVILAILFFLISLLLGNINSKQNKSVIQTNIRNTTVLNK
ncbi:preprotein translocase subunit SecG [Candidatus Blochmannia ocreatus (nom. nud.)]|uniref:Protein-export membrane protein SecG n=1 Tax=Candidatus Blochmannia ocreatus (nom. nud.) TaxID=251538 RepID=A0ABY4SWL3_9ENTR|nr:preprotein translocase subunit SecG [Candidatus Blochmannia ocreatus]URJ25186.1 preprotein translocase subunit SecG [Candidatus Blochmannia ocreatus]